jgi:16S rRNA (uracil1498-N3)-methyltransferase
MRIPRIYQDHPLEVGQTIELDVFATTHIIRALRMRVGNLITLFNGQGGEYTAQIETINKKTTHVNVTEFIDKTVESPLGIHLGQVISRGNKMDFTIQKAVELGVTAITPIVSERCNVHLDEERKKKRLIHWERIIISACEQSGRTVLPTLHPITRIDRWIQQCETPLKLILHPAESDASFDKSGHYASAALLVGSEGGLTDNEIALATQHAFLPIQLGARVLRTETAGLAALSVLQYVFGDFNSSH